MLTMHHIAFDGWSLTPMFRDVGEAFGCRRGGRRAGRRWRCSMSITRCGSVNSSASSAIRERDRRQLAFWEQTLAGMPERLALPTDRPYPLAADYRGALVEVAWPPATTAGTRVARHYKATSFMVLQAALAVVLAKISASTDVAVGFSIAGRRIPHSMSWSAFSPTRWCCASSGRGSQHGRTAGPSPTAQPGRLRTPRRALRGARRTTQPRSITDPPATDPGDVGLAKPTRTRQRPSRRVRWAICTSPRCRWIPAPPEWIWRFRWGSVGVRPVSPPGSAG